MRVTVLLFLSTSTTSILAINFPSSNPSSPSSPAHGRLVFNRQTFSTASCAASGETVNTVSLNTGEGRVFQSANYPSNYPDGQSCTYNFEPAAGNQLVFSCSDYDLKATSALETTSGSTTRTVSWASRGPATVTLTVRPSATPPTSTSSSRRTMTALLGKVLTVRWWLS